MLPILYKYSPSYSGASVDTTPFNERYTGRGSALVYTASCLLKCPSMSAVYATEVSAAEYLTYTTEESEKTEVFALAEELGGDLELAIRRLAETKYK